MRPCSSVSSGLSTTTLALIVAAGAAGLTGAANAQQWTVINLHPAGLLNSEAHAIHGAQVVGMTGVNQGALLWTGSADSVVRLDPNSGSAVANGVFNGQQGGDISVGTGADSRSHAVIWNSTKNSMIDLHPGAAVAFHTLIYAVGDTTQGGSFVDPTPGTGFSTGRPCMWSGTAASFVDLTPAGYSTGAVNGCFGNQQVGATYDSFLGTACMWYGSAESFVNLQPEEGIFSAAVCSDGAHQYGVIGILDPVPGLFPCRWSGTAESFEVFDVPDPESHWGEVHAVFNGYTAGYITDNDGISNSKACVWTGEDGVYADIHQYLPAGLTESNALGVWRHEASGTTYIVGWGLRGATQQREAVMWVNGSGTNLIASAAAPADSSAAPGQPMTYAVHVLNAGPVASGPVTLTVTLPPAGVATFASSTPAPTSLTSSQAVFTLSPISGSGGAAPNVSITLTAHGSGTTATITAAASTAGEVDPTNNTASASSLIQGTPCAADLGMQGGVPGQDAALDNNDFVVFIDYFFNQNAKADVGVQGGVPGHDGAWDNNDFVVFIDLFFAGC
jgi:hypothetical protein